MVRPAPNSQAIWMGDYGYVTLMPEIDTLKTSPEDRKLPFTHAERDRPAGLLLGVDECGELAQDPHRDDGHRALRLYAVYLSSQCFFQSPAASRPGIAGFAHADAAAQITGYNPDRMDSNLGPMKLPNFKGYFVIQFHQAFTDSGTYGPTQQQPGVATGAYATFKTTGRRRCRGTSWHIFFISIEDRLVRTLAQRYPTGTLMRFEVRCAQPGMKN